LFLFKDEEDDDDDDVDDDEPRTWVSPTPCTTSSPEER
jgi:hypothetical protein